MFIFMLSGVPLAFFIMLSVYRLWREGKALLIEDLGWGIRVFIPSLIIFMIVRYFMKKEWQLESLFYFFTIRDYGLWAFLAFTGYYILYGFGKKGFSHKASEIMGYLMGFYIFTGIIDTLIQFDNYDLYTLFMMPMLRISMIFLFTLFFALSGNLDFRIQILVALGCLLITALGGLTGMLYYGRFLAGAWLSSGVIFAAGILSMIIILKKSRSTSH